MQAADRAQDMAEAAGQQGTRLQPVQSHRHWHRRRRRGRGREHGRLLSLSRRRRRVAVALALAGVAAVDDVVAIEALPVVSRALAAAA